MAETMEQYMSKTQADYGSGVARPKIEDKDNFELKGQFLKDLQMQEVVLFYNGLDVPTRQILDSRRAISSKTAADTKVPTTPKITHLRKNGKLSKKLTTLNLVHLFKEGDIEQLLWDSTKGTMQTLQKKGSYGLQFSKAYSYGASHINKSIPQKEKDPGSFTLHCYINNVCFDNALADLGASVSVMPLSTYLNLGLGELAHTKLRVELADRTMKYPKGIAKNMLVGIGKFVFPVDFVILDMPEDIKVPLILGRPFLSIAHAKIDVFKRKITLRVGVEKIIFKSVKPDSSLIKRVYMINLRERMELDLEARRDQVDYLMPTIEEGKIIKEFRARNDVRMVSKIFEYSSDCDHDKKIRINCSYNLKFSCMIGFEFLHANFFPILHVNVMSKKFYNSIKKDKLEYQGNNVVEALMNIPIFVGTFSILTDFAVLEDMDTYRDKGMGDVIFGEPFLREVGINETRFEGMITIYNDNEEVTYQMVRSHLRFKHHTNEQCNKILPLLKVSEEDKINGILHSYQKLKSFYKGVLNLGLEYVRDAKIE
ncbi:putative reverse transcriptase domain-containing protein [Tanacetum coccineum]